MTTLIEAYGHIPYGFVLCTESEISRDETGALTGDPILTATVFQHPPGWEPGDVFDDGDPDHGWKDARHPEDRFRDRPVFSITAVSAEAFDRLLVAAILKRWPKPYVTWSMTGPRLAPDEALHLAMSGQCRYCKHLAVLHQDYCTVPYCECDVCVLGAGDIEPRT